MEEIHLTQEQAERLHLTQNEARGQLGVDADAYTVVGRQIRDVANGSIQSGNVRLETAAEERAFDAIVAVADPAPSD